MANVEFAIVVKVAYGLLYDERYGALIDSVTLKMSDVNNRIKELNYRIFKPLAVRYKIGRAHV